jgi:predicted dehydrogenase
VVVSLSGTALVPGGETECVGKQARLQIYGHKGTLLYAGNDSQEDSGHMELRRVETGGTIEYPAGDGFYFENTKQDGDGPESLQSFISSCLGEEYYDGAGSLLGLKTVQVIHAMYRSSQSSQLEKVQYTYAAKTCVGDA